IKRKPRFTEMIVSAQDGAGGISLEFLSFWIFKIKLYRAAYAQQFLDLGKAALAVFFQRSNERVALLQCQRLFLQAFPQDAQIIDFLIHTESLRAGKGERGAFLFGQKCTTSRFDRFERALVQ